MKIIDALFPKMNFSNRSRWMHINLNNIAKSVGNLIGTNPFLDPRKMWEWLDFIHNLSGADYSYGGYLEDRKHLWRGHYHEPGKTTHLGVDFNIKKDTVVCTPIGGTVIEAFIDGDNNGGWGGKITLKCDVGHLTFAHLKNIPVGLIGQYIAAGSLVGLVAEPELNGGWYEHLHIQCSKQYDPQLDGYIAYYPGIENDYINPMELII